MRSSDLTGGIVIAIPPNVLEQLLAEHDGCPLRTAAHHPELRDALMAFNAELEASPPTMCDATAARVQHALESILRARVRLSQRKRTAA